MSDELREGDRVRVSRDCPLTLPAYAHVLVGVVVEKTPEGSVTVRFGDDREFPLPARWLERVDDAGGG